MNHLLNSYKGRDLLGSSENLIFLTFWKKIMMSYDMTSIFYI